MHTHIHRIQLNAYLICTLYIGYAQTCICMYLTVSACILAALAHWSCIKCIFACMSYTYMPAYMKIHTHMHCSKAMHMCMYFCHEYMHMCIFESSACLYVSDCISRSHTFTYASILWFLLRQIGRPQQRAVARDSNPDSRHERAGQAQERCRLGKVVLPTGESIRGAAGLEITIRKSLTIRHCP